MGDDTSVAAFLEDLNALANRHGWTQIEMAARLGISQGQLSKIFRGKHRPSRRVRGALGRISHVERQPDDAWLSAVSKAADTSADFRTAVDAMLRVMRFHAADDRRQKGGD